MTTMIVDMESGADIRRVAAAMRQLKGVVKVRVQKDRIERIPGIPHTREELLADVRKAEDDYAAGRTITSEELKRRMDTW